LTDYDITVTIYDEDIPLYWLKKIQKLKSALLEKHWKVGTIQEKENIIRFHEYQVLDQDIRIFWFVHQTIRIRTGHDIDRDNLKLMEKILGRRADIDISDKNEIELSFNCSDGANKPDEYEKFGVFKTKNDIPRRLDGHICEIYGYKWNTEIDA